MVLSTELPTSSNTISSSRISRIYRTLSDKAPIPTNGLAVRRSRSLNKAYGEQEEIETRVQEFFDDFFDRHPMSRQEKKNAKKTRSVITQN